MLKLSDNCRFYYMKKVGRNTGSKIKNGYTLYVNSGLFKIDKQKFKK